MDDDDDFGEIVTARADSSITTSAEESGGDVVTALHVLNRFGTTVSERSVMTIQTHFDEVWKRTSDRRVSMKTEIRILHAISNLRNEDAQQWALSKSIHFPANAGVGAAWIMCIHSAISHLASAISEETETNVIEALTAAVSWLPAEGRRRLVLAVDGWLAVHPTGDNLLDLLHATVVQCTGDPCFLVRFEGRCS